MRLSILSTFLILFGLSVSACGGEAVEDRARALKAAQKPPPGPGSPLESATPGTDAPAPKATGSSSAGTPPTPAPQKP